MLTHFASYACRLRSCTDLLVLIHLLHRPADPAKLHNVCEVWNSSVTPQIRPEPVISPLFDTREAGKEAVISSTT